MIQYRWMNIVESMGYGESFVHDDGLEVFVHTNLLFST